MSLKQRLTDDMKAAMKGGEKDRLGVIRLINAAIKQREVDERIVLDDSQVLATIEKMLKQRKDSLSQYEAAGREDLAAVERYEMTVLQVYLPAQLDDAEIDAIIAAAIAEAGATGPKDMGKVIGLIRPKVAGRADMGVLSERVKTRLANLG
ncbi:MAG: glutamyl-tRNA amidotransferase [Lysobacterales bacterium 69-70]|nr:GatB/YqeY domain-containing protein [Xanthomonadaceae bacterium]ODU31232.1 MAG: glutamyl-tRNA amidotransferase [Xanthomonadaceae bacterium SCN 69-320]ODV22715.1 MAG: glutamyl-tRNA amidotransferase [Xanthomonadaceae bacterium SCN 69-25]OJY98821.1 MAG: glutamyl-tRNA amidotransferase [Xanthomonadales bacterium 69-70]